MLTIWGRSNRFCDQVSRRHFLQVGAAGIGGLALPQIYAAESSPRSSRRPKSIINIYLAGGPSHIDTFDPKPQAAKEFRGDFQTIDTQVPGIQVSEHLPQLAARMEQMTLVRSLANVREEHTPNQTESGWDGDGLRGVGGHPSLGSVLAKHFGPQAGNAPTFVDLTGHTMHGFLGPVYAGFRPDGPGRENLRLNHITVDRLSDRQQLLSGLDRLKRGIDNSGMMDAVDSFTSRAVSVITSGKLADALNLEQEDPRIRARYLRGDENYRENERFLMARRLIQAGVRAVSLSWGGWDTHGDNFKHLAMQLPRFDQGVSTLLDDLAANGLLEDTMVLMWGEFGRTPRVNGSAGRDHWPHVMSLALAGGGLRTGQVIGSTNRNGEFAKDRPVHVQEIFATLYYQLGIDPKYTTLVDPNGRPQYLVDLREPMRELV